MENNLLDPDGFVKVSKKKSAKARKLKSNSSSSDAVDVNTCLRNIEKAKHELAASSFFQTFSSLIKEICVQVDKSITQIICLGIGAISTCKTAQYQLALLSALKQEIADCPTEVYDPVFGQSDIDILNSLNFKVSNQNTEGKIAITPSTYTFFILPHCPKELFNNLLFSNWSVENLENCLVYGNSLEKLKLSTPKRFLEPFYYLVNSESIAEEIEVPNNFTFTDIFNDLSLHYFPARLLSCVESSFWEHPKPVYLTESELIKEDGCSSDAERPDS